MVVDRDGDSDDVGVLQLSFFPPEWLTDGFNSASSVVVVVAAALSFTEDELTPSPATLPTRESWFRDCQKSVLEEHTKSANQTNAEKFFAIIIIYFMRDDVVVLEYGRHGLRCCCHSVYFLLIGCRDETVAVCCWCCYTNNIMRSPMGIGSFIVILVLFYLR